MREHVVFPLFKTNVERPSYCPGFLQSINVYSVASTIPATAQTIRTMACALVKIIFFGRQIRGKQYLYTPRKQTKEKQVGISVVKETGT